MKGIRLGKGNIVFHETVESNHRLEVAIELSGETLGAN